MSVAAFSRSSVRRSSYQGIGSSSQKMSWGAHSAAARTAVGRFQPWLASSMMATSRPTALRISPTRSASASGDSPPTFTFTVR